MLHLDPWAAASHARSSDRWATASARWNLALTDALIAAAAISPKSLVLDLAAGSGDPALDIVQRLASVRVLALDRSPAGLVLAKRQSEQLGVASRINFVQSDVHSIPLASNCVDRITCRFGVMFFDDIGLAMSEMLRVLKPGGRVALLAWGPFKQPFFESTIGAVLRLVAGTELPEPARAMYGFASHGSLGTALSEGGFRDVNEIEMSLPRIWAGTEQHLWEYLQEVSTLCYPLFAAIPADLRPNVAAEVTAGLAQFRSGELLSVPVQVVLATGKRD